MSHYFVDQLIMSLILEIGILVLVFFFLALNTLDIIQLINEIVNKLINTENKLC